MKSKNDCLEEIQNGEHDKYPYLQTLTDYLPPEVAEERLRLLCQAIGNGLSDYYALSHAISLFNCIDISMRERAESMSEKSISPYDESTIADIEREK